MPTTSLTTAEQSRCPLCRGANDCAIVANRDAVGCWCQLSPIEPSAIAAVRQLGEAKCCICQRCSEQARQLSREL